MCLFPKKYLSSHRSFLLRNDVDRADITCAIVFDDYQWQALPIPSSPPRIEIVHLFFLKRATDIEHVIFRLQVFIDEHIYHTRQH